MRHVAVLCAVWSRQTSLDTRLTESLLLLSLYCGSRECLRLSSLLPALPAAGTQPTRHTASLTRHGHMHGHSTRAHTRQDTHELVLRVAEHARAPSSKGLLCEEKGCRGKARVRRGRVGEHGERVCRIAVYLPLLQARLCSASRCATRPLRPRAARTTGLHARG